jgi:serine-type D-Ala-D-Ala carboxypeptidase/endopeptidase (penicillin-binding protein 4)
MINKFSSATIYTLVVLGCLVGIAHTIPISQLAAQIDAIINQPQYARSEWGVWIVSNVTGGSLKHRQQYSTAQPYSVLYARNHEQYFTPASNNKVPTTAAALMYLGAQFRIQTPVSSSNASLTANLADLCVAGRGDASFSSDAQLIDLAMRLQSAGVRSIETLLFNDLYFPALPPASYVA